MFEHSMKGNIIAVMGTGTGKTPIAKLRIEAELERSIGKRVWFTAPSVVLAYQQYGFLSKQLPRFQFRLITGRDNAEYWKSQDVWQKALHNIHVVVSTPRILLDALDSAFVSLDDISLLVFDEAHHCLKDGDLRLMMTRHYHPRKSTGSGSPIPCILGLSASPRTTDNAQDVEMLERNLDAKCKTPLQQLEEYTDFVKMPQIVVLTFSGTLDSRSGLLADLQSIVSKLDVDDDPIMQKLRRTDSVENREKLDKYISRGCTPAMKDMETICRSAGQIHKELGSWACDIFVEKCIQQVELVSQQTWEAATPALSKENCQFVDSSLEPIRSSLESSYPVYSETKSLAPKTEALMKFLTGEQHLDPRGIIFVKTRHTAWALTELINVHFEHQGYSAFSFVGVSNPAHQGVLDFAELGMQFDNLERFRRGDLNLCVATQVLEEGIDVPAANMVICFDERPNFRSFVQSRGRARQRDSKFVIFGDPSLKVAKWQVLEKQMLSECEESTKEWENRRNIEETIERVDETDGEIYRVPSTGAVLTYDNARPRLQVFCDKLLTNEECERKKLVFRLDGVVGHDLSATVYLPSSVPPSLQVACSKFSWRTEKMAKRDASFQAYLALHRAGLVTDHLLPPEPVKHQNEDQDDGDHNGIQKRDSVYAVQKQHDPWLSMRELWDSSSTVYAHRLHIEGRDCNYPNMLILLPQKLDGLRFPLWMTYWDRLQVTLDAGHCAQEYSVDLARDATFHMLTTVLGRRLQGLEKEQIPFLLVPDMEPGSLRTWYQKACASTPMMAVLEKSGLGEEDYLVQSRQDRIPYVYRGGSVDTQGTSDKTNEPQRMQDGEISTHSLDSLQIRATRLSKRLDYLTLAIAPSSPPAIRSHLLPVDECDILGLSPDYARLILLVPSITHMLEVTLRSAHACAGPLSSLGFDNLDIVSEALTLPRVGDQNYQRLEFLGDNTLKLYSSIQVFVDHPLLPESQLTIYRDRLINNARLQQSTRSLAVDQFLTRHRFSAADWRAGVRRQSRLSDKPSQKNLSSKVLADVIESLLGATSLIAMHEKEAEARIVGALKLFLPEVEWRTTAENLKRIEIKSDESLPGLDRLAAVESMIGYTFQHRSLLAESLTQSGLGGAISTYNRLEFLGDALLDDIVKKNLFHCPYLDPYQMTLRRHALVSHATLAFFALQTSYVCHTFEVKTNPVTRKTVKQEAMKTVYLPDHIRRIGGYEDGLDHDHTLAAYEEVRSAILDEFDQGSKFPWAKLLHLGAPKSYSDIIESILGAVFIDSQGDWDMCIGVLDRMGFMKLLKRAASDYSNFDTNHPEAVLKEFNAACKPVAQQRKAKSEWRCKVMLNDKRIAHASRARCKDEAICQASERAVRVLKDLEETKKLDREKREDEEASDGPPQAKEDDDDDDNDDDDNDVTMT